MKKYFSILFFLLLGTAYAKNAIFFKILILANLSEPISYVENGKLITVPSTNLTIVNCMEHLNVLGVYSKFEGTSMNLAMNLVKDLPKKNLGFPLRKGFPNCPNTKEFFVKPRVILSSTVDGSAESLCDFEKDSVSSCSAKIDKIDNSYEHGVVKDKDWVDNGYRTIVNEKGQNSMRYSEKKFGSSKQ